RAQALPERRLLHGSAVLGHGLPHDHVHAAVRAGAHAGLARPLPRDDDRPPHHDRPSAPDLRGRGRALLRPDRPARVVTEQAVREPVVLRHKDASRQSALYAVFALVALAPVVPLFLAGGTARWASIVLLPVVLVAGYAALRLATLKVRLDADGIWEPDP